MFVSSVTALCSMFLALGYALAISRTHMPLNSFLNYVAFLPLFAPTMMHGIDSVPEGFPADPVKQMIENDLVWAAESRERILDEWNRRYGMKETR